MNIGSIIAITDIQGSTIEQYAYSAFGQMKIYDGSGVEIQSSQIGNIFGFTGREFDAESDLYYYRARYYDPNSGRFLTADPIGFDGGDPNLYGYVLQDPVNFVDPDGEFLIVPIIGGALIGAGLELGSQLLENGGNFSCVDGGAIGAAAAVGAVGGGLLGNIGRPRSRQ